MSSVLSFLLLMVLFVMAAGLTRQYIFINQRMSWTGAQSYCRKNYKDLATITTEEENQSFTNISGKLVAGWIGLTKITLFPPQWQWSDGEPPTLFNWIDKNDVFPYYDCVKLNQSGWSTDFCDLRYPFTCYRSLILINESKTWNDALRYCRMFYTDLAFAGSVTNPSLIEMEAAQSQTLSVWMGLRFLDGEWFWVTKEQPDIPDSLPLCPIQNDRCGTRNIETRVWENRDCDEKLNFLCY